MSLRMLDFQCAKHGVFEVLLDTDAKGDERYDAVRSQPCAKCGDLAPHVWVKAPALGGLHRHLVRFGGHLHDEADLERRFSEASATPEPEWFETRDGEAELAEAYKRNKEREIAGTLPPVNTPEEIHAVASAMTKE